MGATARMRAAAASPLLHPLQSSPRPPSPPPLPPTLPREAPANRRQGWAWARALDAFPKTYEDFVERTRAGGLISVVLVTTICALVLSDVLAFALNPPYEVVAMDVDTTPAAGRMAVLFDVEFPSVPCVALTLDVTDAFGERQRGVHRAALTSPLQPDVGALLPLAERCGPCLLPAPSPGSKPQDGPAASEEPCCSTCEEVRATQHAHGLIGGWRTAPQCRAARSHAADGLQAASDTQEPLALHAGCRAYGSVVLERAAGQLRFSAGTAGPDAPIWEQPGPASPSRTANVSHLVRSFAFAAHNAAHSVRFAADGGARGRGSSGGALDDVAFTDQSATGDISRVYLVTVVPTRRVRAGVGRAPATVLHTGYEYSFTEHSEASAGAAHARRRTWAGVTIAFELSPIAVVTTEQPRLLLDLLASVTAIIGGGVTLAMLLDACVHSLRDAVDTRGPRGAERWGKLHAR